MPDETKPVVASDADITDELEKGGPALGTFLKQVGLAVAASQEELDKTFRATASMLSQQQIDVIAVFEQIINDNGEMEQGIAQIQKLPLINYVMPVGYQFQRVYLEADMNVQEFNAARGLNIKGSSLQIGAQAGITADVFGLRGGGGASFGYSNYDREMDSSSSQDMAAGSLHLEATLEPRDEIALPSPLILQKGPKLSLRLVSRSNISGTAPQGGGEAPVIGRQATFEIVLKKTDGTPNDGKDIDINISDPLVELETTTTTTDANGKIAFNIKRQWGTLGEGEKVPDPTSVIVSVTFGVIVDSASTTV